mgnify:CR=1 FL=1
MRVSAEQPITLIFISLIYVFLLPRPMLFLIGVNNDFYLCIKWLLISLNVIFYSITLTRP